MRPDLLTIGLVVLGAGGSLLALVLFLRQTLALKVQQREVHRLVQAAHDRLQLEMAQRTTQLTELAQHLLNAREDERNHLARELHDELGALLTSARLDAARIKSRLAGTAPEALERLCHLVEMLDGMAALKRRIIENLRPSALTHLGLATTLEILAREFAEHSGIEVHCALDPVRLQPNAELVADTRSRHRGRSVRWPTDERRRSSASCAWSAAQLMAQAASCVTSSAPPGSAPRAGSRRVCMGIAFARCAGRCCRRGPACWHCCWRFIRSSPARCSRAGCAAVPLPCMPMPPGAVRRAAACCNLKPVWRS